MNTAIKVIILLFLTIPLCVTNLHAQTKDRIEVYGQDLWLSGSNVAWVEFAEDLGPGTAQLSEFERMFTALRANGGNSVRLWLHTTGGSTPAWNGQIVTGPGEDAIANLAAILDLAEENDISVLLSIWSFDMLRETNGQQYTDRARAILTENENRQSYIYNSLIPMVEGVKGHKAILAWEIFNEAEGMSKEFGWDGVTGPEEGRVSMANIQAFVNLTAGAIKRTDPSAQVTNGINSFEQLSDIYTSDNPSHMNYYRDDRLREAGGDADGVLDFYTVHYYGDGDSPFTRHADYFELDKPLVLGEFFVKDVDGIAKERLYEKLHDNGYAGALSWQWVDWAQNREDNHSTWPNTLINTRYMYSHHRNDVELNFSDKPASFTFSASDTTIESGFSTTISWTSRDVAEITLNGEPVHFMDDLEVQPDSTKNYILTLTDADGTAQEDTLTINVIQSTDVDRADNAPVFTAENKTSMYIDLEASYNVGKIIIPFITRPENEYNIQGSYDGHQWTDWETVQTNAASSDTISFTSKNKGNFIRIVSEEAFEVGSLKVYGLLADVQAPRITITEPLDGAVLDLGTQMDIKTLVAQGTGSINFAAHYINGEEKFRPRARPYNYSWKATQAGEYEIKVLLNDTNFTEFYSRPVTVSVVGDTEIKRYEAQDADLTGSLTVNSSSEASGGQYVEMIEDGALTWSDIEILESGEFTLRIGYNLPYGEKTQNLHVNNELIGEVTFPEPTKTWQYVEQNITLESGTNSLQIDHSWGWMWFDYIEIRGNEQAVSAENNKLLPATHRLEQNYPNPFNPVTIIQYQLPAKSHVSLRIYDLLGREAASLVDGQMREGTHEVSFDASPLSSGVYIYRMEAESFTRTRQMMLIK
ncbi:MAG: CBM35 domain-containing protein [Balneolales bacterium]